MKRRRQTTEHKEPDERYGAHQQEPSLAGAPRKEKFTTHFDEDPVGGMTYLDWVGLFLLLTSGGFLLWQVVIPTFIEFFNTSSTVSIYTIRHATSNVGDKSLNYQILRLFYDLPKDHQRSLQAVKDLNWRQYRPIQGAPYNIFNCPSIAPDGYPYAWNVLDVVTHWPTNDSEPRDTIYQGLCVFDYQTDYDKAMHYRSRELPFVMRGDPHVAETVERWHQPGYMKRLLGDTPHRTEVANHSRYMYWLHPELAKRRAARAAGSKYEQLNYDPPPGWVPPTQVLKMSYPEWLEIVNSTEPTKGDHDFYYFQTVGCGDVPKCEEGATEFLFDELPYFQPQRDDNLYVVDADKQKGIHCRFGMPGLSIAAHFDGTRNTIVVLTGSRRYILAHPRECPNLGLHPMGHPSARHSGLSWDATDSDNPSWKTARVNEAVLQAGDVLYLPTHWFHMIISLDTNIQCNTRSGIDGRFTQSIKECGFRQDY